jgi:hypothetical protein
VNKHAQALGRLGGRAGRGLAKVRPFSPAQARAAALARWARPGARKKTKKSRKKIEAPPQIREIVGECP